MSKIIADVQLRSKAAILAEEGYSYSVIGDKLGRTKDWVAKWVERSKQGELGDHARCGRPTTLTQTAIKIIKKAKYRHTSIYSEYYISNILNKEIKPVYARLDTSGTISK